MEVVDGCQIDFLPLDHVIATLLFFLLSLEFLVASTLSGQLDQLTGWSVGQSASGVSFLWLACPDTVKLL